MLPDTKELLTVFNQLSLATEKLAGKKYAEFESEYISLFDYAKEHKPLHLYAHLYSKEQAHPAKAYQRSLNMFFICPWPV